MIAKLVIGPAREPGEIPSPLVGHPRSLSAWTRMIHADNEAHLAAVVCTYAPAVIREACRLWREDVVGVHHRIVLRGWREGRRDVCLTDVRTPDWLAHFQIEDLYLHGEFDAFLDDEPTAWDAWAEAREGGR